MINGKIGQTTKLSLCARKDKSSHCTLVLPRNSSTFLSFTFPRIKTRLSRAQDACRSRKSRSQTLRGYRSAPRRRPLGKGNAGSRNVLSPSGSASVSFFVDLICLKNKKETIIKNKLSFKNICPILTG